MMIVIIEHQCLRSVDSCLEQAHCLWILKFFNPILDKFFTSPILSIQQTLDFLSLLGSTLRGKTPGTRRLERWCHGFPPAASPSRPWKSLNEVKPAAKTMSGYNSTLGDRWLSEQTFSWPGLSGSGPQLASQPPFSEDGMLFWNWRKKVTGRMSIWNWCFSCCGLSPTNASTKAGSPWQEKWDWSKDRGGNLEEVRPGEHEWRTKLAFWHIEKSWEGARLLWAEAPGDGRMEWKEEDGFVFFDVFA